MSETTPRKDPLFDRLRRAWRSFRMTEAAGLTLEEGPGWRPLTGDGRRDLGPLSQRRMQELAVHQWERNRLANRNTMLTLNPTFRTFAPEKGVAYLKLRGDRDLVLEGKDERTLAVRAPRDAETVFERSPDNGIRIEVTRE